REPAYLTLQCDGIMRRSAARLQLFDGDCCRSGKGGQDLDIFDAEGAVLFVEDLKNAEDAAILSRDRNRQQTARHVSCALIDGGIEARVGVRVGNVDRFAGERNSAGNALAERQANNAHSLVEGDL